MNHLTGAEFIKQVLASGLISASICGSVVHAGSISEHSEETMVTSGELGYRMGCATARGLAKSEVCGEYYEMKSTAAKDAQESHNKYCVQVSIREEKAGYIKYVFTNKCNENISMTGTIGSQNISRSLPEGQWPVFCYINSGKCGNGVIQYSLRP